MNICVIKPSMFGGQAKDALPPLLFAILKPLTPPEVKLEFFDENIKRVPKNINCDVMAISIDTFTARRGYILASQFRARGIIVVLGGIHATLCPDEAAQYADAVVVGDAEDTWGIVVTDLQKGLLRPRYISGNNTNLGEIRYDYSVFRGKKYNPICIVQFSRGCKFSCDFCSVYALHRRVLRTRPVAAVTEIFRQFPRKLLFFSDDNLFSSLTAVDELLTALEPLKRRWVCQISMDVARDFALLCRLRRSGCVMVIMGFESLSADNLRQMKKSANLEADYEMVITNIRRAGLMLYGTFVIGYDADTAKTALELVAFANKHGFAIANFNPLTPTPGTALYERLEREGRLLYPHWWNNPNYRYGDTIFEPKSITSEQLAESCRQARYAFYSFRGILSRLRSVNVRGFFNTWVYILVNTVSGTSIRHKQGRRLGG